MNLILMSVQFLKNYDRWEILFSKKQEPGEFSENNRIRKVYFLMINGITSRNITLYLFFWLFYFFNLIIELHHWEHILNAKIVIILLQASDTSWSWYRDKEAYTTLTEENKQKFDEALLDKKKNCILPGGLFSKVKIYLIFHLISFFFLQVLDYVTYKEENSDTLEPLNPDACLFCFNNMETYRSEVIHSYSKIFFKRFL